MLIAFVGCVLAAVSSPEVSAQPEPQAITGGTAVATCGWPTAVWMQGCTGTLIDSQHIIYAAHCEPPGEAYFGEDASSGEGRSVRIDECWKYPDGAPGNGRDFGLCRLAETVDATIVPPLMGCETAVLAAGQEVTIVGFGETENGDFGIKHEVTTTIVGSDGDELMIGGEGLDSCNGDSGGPVFVDLGDGAGWRVFGVTSYGNADCVSGGFYSQIHLGMEWFEETAQRDFTPCHDADGTWNPDPRCTRFPLQPQVGDGLWFTGCMPGPESSTVTTCGDGHQAPTGGGPPTARIVDPGQGDEFASDRVSGTVPVSIEVEAQGGGLGIATVELSVGDEVRTDGLAPFTYEVELGPGVYELEATVFNFAGGNGRSEVVFIGVDETPPAIPGGEDNEGGCGCRAGIHGRTAALLTLVLALLWRRRMTGARFGVRRRQWL